MARRPAKPVALSPDDRFIILSGKETFLHHEHTSRLRDALKEKFGQLDVIRFDGQSVDVAAVLDECRSFGLLAAHKLVIVDDAEQLVREDARPLFERYAQSPCEGATLVLRSSAWRPGKLDKLATVIRCDPLKEPEAIGWAVRRARDAHGLTLEQPAAAELIGRTGTDLAHLDADLAKLALAAADGRATRDIVRTLVAMTRQLEPWPLREALLSGSAERSIRHIRETLENTRNTEIPLLFACSNLARDLHSCVLAQQLRISQAELASRLGKKSPWQIKDAYAAARKLDPSRTAALLKACTRADAHAKSGVGHTDRTLETLSVLFAQSMR
ncbi:MAG: DNA polymerase III subunit delta [Planctomycetota bacterium]|nr:MAG: DNA polymerase III subunit delta [Planctomycetota bacterium]